MVPLGPASSALDRFLVDCIIATQESNYRYTQALASRNIAALRAAPCEQLEQDAFSTANAYMREVRIAALKRLELQGWARPSKL